MALSDAAGVPDEQAAAASPWSASPPISACSTAPNFKPGETVFVNGGTGGVGSMVVQMAKAVGASVITTVGCEEKAKLARELGPTVVINYKTDDRGREGEGGHRQGRASTSGTRRSRRPTSIAPSI